MSAGELLLLGWAALIFWVLGQIWFAQLVIYPLFAQVGATEYISYHRFYANRILLPVILPGFASFVMPVVVALFGPPLPRWLTIGNVAGGAVSLLVTLACEIPRHDRLEQTGKSERVIRELVRFNWPRTVAITAQAAFTGLMLVAFLAR